MNLKRIPVLLICIAATVTGLWAQSAEEIIRKMDEMQTFDTMYTEGTMTTEDARGEKRSTYNSWSRGSQDFLIEFTNVEERGQKILRVDEELYIFSPHAEDIYPMHGAALKQSMFGDISYEDMTEGRNTLDKYDVEIMGSETVNGEDCWVIDMVATTRDVPYPRQVIRVGKDDYVLKEGDYFSKSGRLLKTIEVTSVQEFDDGRVLMTGMILRDQLRRGSSTSMSIDYLEIDPDLDDSLFSLRSLY